MNHLLRSFALVVFFLFTATLRADRSLEHARRAQSLLGPEVWSRVIRIENREPSARRPRELSALVFELAGILWFYRDAEGTQSFSLHEGRLAEEKADFAPLLRGIDAGFTRWAVVPEGATAAAEASREPLPNACLIESVVALRDRLAHGREAVHPRLLSYYVDTREGWRGHTVLAYETAGRVEVIDPALAGKHFTVPLSSAAEPLQLARALLGNRVASARAIALATAEVRGLATAASAVASSSATKPPRRAAPPSPATAARASS